MVNPTLPHTTILHGRISLPKIGNPSNHHPASYACGSQRRSNALAFLLKCPSTHLWRALNVPILRTKSSQSHQRSHPITLKTSIQSHPSTKIRHPPPFPLVLRRANQSTTRLDIPRRQKEKVKNTPQTTQNLSKV